MAVKIGTQRVKKMVDEFKNESASDKPGEQ
jgi:hypothetical protein